MRDFGQIGIFAIICSLFILLLLARDFGIEDFVLVNNLVSLFLMLAFIIEIRSNHFLKKDHFLPYPFSHLKLIITRTTLFYKKFFLWKLIFIPPVIILFINGQPDIGNIRLYLHSVLQNVFTVYLFFTLYDFLFAKGYEKHINVFPALLVTIIIFSRQNQAEFMYFYNPFGGIINVPLHFNDLFYYFVIPFSFFVVFLVNKLFLHKIWVRNNVE